MTAQILDWKLNQNQHVIAKHNEEYFNTSKVKIPTDEKYNRTKYSEIVKESFRKLKREFTGKSQDCKVSINYLDIKEKYSTERRQVFQIKFVNILDSKNLQGESVHAHALKDIEKSIPQGFKLDSVSTNIFRYDQTDEVERKKYFGHIPKDHMDFTIQYEKTTGGRK